MKKLNELFQPFHGIPVGKVKFVDIENENSIKFFRPSKTYKGTFNAYIDKSRINEKHIFPKNTLFVSTNGQGSHSYAWVSTSDFVPNSDITVLIPKEEMSDELKLFYAYCITKNRYRYSYGRKPKGKRLMELLLPSDEEIPLWFDQIVKLGPVLECNTRNEFLKTDDLPIETSSYYNKDLIPLSELFDSKCGISSSNVKRYPQKFGDKFIPYLRPSKTQSTSVDAYVNSDEISNKAMIFPKDTLYVSTDGQGSHSYAWVSTSDFVPNSNTLVLLPKREMSIKEKLFYSYVITKNRYKFSYGRKPKGDRLVNIKIPKFPPPFINNISFLKTDE